MAKFNFNNHSFINGELSNKFLGRSNTQEYANGCNTLENMLVFAQGGATRRPGSQYVYTSSDENIRLFPFQFSKEESYIVAAKADSDTMTIFNVNDGSIFDVTYNNTPGATLNGNLDRWDDNSGGGGWGAEELVEVQYTQSADIMFFTHPNRIPIHLDRLDKNEFQLLPYYKHPEVDDPSATQNIGTYNFKFKDLNVTATTLQPSATAVGAATVTASGSDVFKTGHIGSVWFITNGSGAGGAFLITNFTSATSVTVQILSTLPSTSAVTTWFAPSWSRVDGYPRSCELFDGRIFYGGTESSPDTIWTSALGDLFKLTDETDRLITPTTLTDEKPYQFTFTTGEVNKIQWMSSGRNLNVGTFGREHIIEPLDPTGTLAGNNTSVRSETKFGSDYVQGMRVQNTVNFVQRGGEKVREFIFNRDENSFRSQDQTLLSEHISKKGMSERADFKRGQFVQMQLQQADSTILWFLDSNGFLNGYTTERTVGVGAWHRHRLGGLYAGESPRVTSMAAVSSPSGSHDDLYISVKRTINSATVTTVEKIGKEFIDPNLTNAEALIDDKPVFLDAAAYVKAITSPTLHATYESDEDAVLAGGSTTGTLNGGATVSGGALNLDSGGNDSCDYDGTDNADTANVGTVKFLLEPGYSGAPGAEQRLFTICEAASSTNNELSLAHATSGGLRFYQRDNAGGVDNTALFYDFFNDKGWLPEDGRIYEFELNYDINTTDGFVKLFIDGALFGEILTADLSASGRDTTIDLIRLGNDETNSLVPDFQIWDFAISDVVQHDSRYTPTRGKTFFTEGTIVTGLSWLANETVQVLGDGLYLGEVTVDSTGTATLPESVTEAIIGFGYTSTAELMPLNVGSRIGGAIGTVQRVDRLVFQFYRTVGAKFGANGGTTDEISFRDPSVPMDEPIAIFTGLKVVNLSKGYDREIRPLVIQDKPLPMTVSGIISRGITYD